MGAGHFISSLDGTTTDIPEKLGPFRALNRPTHRGQLDGRPPPSGSSIMLGNLAGEPLDVAARMWLVLGHLGRHGNQETLLPTKGHVNISGLAGGF
jgi:hypothetical protein